MSSGKRGSQDKKIWGEGQSSPETLEVVLEVLWLDVGKKDVWLTRGAEELVLGILGRSGGNDCVSVTSSSKRSAYEQKEKKTI